MQQKESVRQRTDSFLWGRFCAQAVSTTCKLRLLGLADTFDGTFLSSDHRCRKPDSRFFAALPEQQHLTPSRVLMIGNDRETDIAGAKAVGLATLYLHTNLTPPHQSEAAESCPPNYEWEGSDWAAITDFLLTL